MHLEYTVLHSEYVIPPPPAPQNEDLAAVAAQQYYIEFGREASNERFTRMLPSVIPDSCLAGASMTERWTQMIMAAFKRVRAR